MELFINNECTNDEHDGCYELENNQYASESATVRSQSQFAFEYFDRPESGQEKSRITASQQTNDKRQSDEQRKNIRGEQTMKHHRFAGDIIKHREYEISKYYGEHQRKDNHQRRLSEKLENQKLSFCAEHFPNTYFLGTAGGACG